MKREKVEVIERAAEKAAEKFSVGKNADAQGIKDKVFRDIEGYDISLSEKIELRKLFMNEVERNLSWPKKLDWRERERANSLYPLKDPRATIFPSTL